MRTPSTHIIKVAVFLVLLGFFFAFAGFRVPQFNNLRNTVYGKQSRVQIAWVANVILYLVGARMVVWGKKTEGVIYPVSHRNVYVIVGGILMVASFLWMLSLKSMDR